MKHIPYVELLDGLDTQCGVSVSEALLGAMRKGFPRRITGLARSRARSAACPLRFPHHCCLLAEWAKSHDLSNGSCSRGVVTSDSAARACACKLQHDSAGGTAAARKTVKAPRRVKDSSHARNCMLPSHALQN